MRVRALIYLAVLAASLCALAVVLVPGHGGKAPARHTGASRSAPTVAATSPRKRPVYPFSIVAGGVGSKEELKAAMKADRLVAAHYAGVDVDRLKPVMLAQDMAAYVSFRMRGQVYWTSRKVRLARGERVFQGETEGAVGVRGRCGNQVSEQPRAPVLADDKWEPTGAQFDTPAVETPAPAVSGHATPERLQAALPQGPGAESSSPPVTAGAGGPSAFQSAGGTHGFFVGGGGGAGGGAAGGGGAGSGGGGGTPGQAAGSAPAAAVVEPGLAPMNVVLPSPPPITYSFAFLPAPAPTPGNPTWYAPPSGQITTTPLTPSGPPPETPPGPPPSHWVVTPPPPGGNKPPETPNWPEIPPGIPDAPPGHTPDPPSPPQAPGPPPETAAVPEPATWWMLGLGLGLLMLRARAGKSSA